MALLEIRTRYAYLCVLAATACNSPAQPSHGEPVAAPAVKPVAPATAPAPAPVAKPAAAAPAPRAAPCDALCAHTLSLGCGPIESCLQSCRAMAASEQCTAQITDALDCMAAQPAANFECDAETQAPAIKERHCDAEQAAVAECFADLPPPA
jgi:hypothetical protein